MTDALVLRQRVRPGEQGAVRDLVADRLSDPADAGLDSLVGSAGVHTASLFLDRSRDGEPGLVWYLEVDDAERGPWADPVTELVGNSPLFDAGLAGLLETPDSARVLSDASAAAAVPVHATLPERPASVGTGADGGTRRAVGPAGGADERPPDVAMLRLRIRPGFGEWFVRALAALMGRLDDEGRIERRFDEWTEPVLREEGMRTETILLERTGGNYYLCWYMEAEEMDEVYEAYFETSNRVARLSEPVIGWVLANPRRALSNPVESSDFELLAHAVSPERA